MKLNYESAFLRQEEGQIPEAQKALYELIVPENKKRTIDIKDFADLYGQEAIRKDETEIANLEKKFASDPEKEASRKLSELFEALVNSQIEESDWMGPNANVIVPSRYDDVKNGVDSIVEFEEDNAKSHLALAIDVTESDGAIASKLERIRHSIDNDELSRVKYFRSGNFRGELQRVPRVIVGAEGKTIQDIGDLVLRFKRMQKTMSEERKRSMESESVKNLGHDLKMVRDEIANHPMQRIILLEIEKQLQIFKDYAEQKDKKAAADSYTKMLGIVQEIITEKNEGVTEKKSQIPDDRIFEMILEHTEDFR